MAQRHVAVYARISKDRAGRAENVETQVKHAREYAARNWPDLPVEVYADNDLSAADPGTYRPEYHRMIADISAGRVAQVVSADQDRLTRQPAEWEALMPTLVAAGITATHGYRDGITPVVMGQRAYGRFKAMMAAEYVDGIKVKVMEKLEARAAEGRPGGPAPYGYRNGVNERGEKTWEIDPHQAKVLREIANRILSGWPIKRIVDDLNARGEPGSKGGPWYPATLRRLMRSPSMIGQRVHRGEVVKDEHGQPIRAAWEPILDEDTWAKVQAALEEPRPGRRRRRAARRYWLTGIPTCWKCDGHLIGARRHNGRYVYPMYVCRTSGCWSTSVRAEATEKYVEEVILGWLNDPSFHAAVAAGDQHAEERRRLREAIAGVEARWEQAGRRHARSEMPDRVWEGISDEFAAERAKLRAELDTLPEAVPQLGDISGLADDWGEMTLDERRFVASRLIGRMVVGPATPTGPKFDPGRIDIAPRWPF